MATINKYQSDYSCIELSINGVVFAGVQSIEYTESVSRTPVYGTGPEVLGFTRGQYAVTGSLELLKSEYDKLTDTVKNIFDANFTAVVTYSNPGERIRVDEIQGIKLNEKACSHSAGSDALVVSMSFDAVKVKSDGKDPLSSDDALESILSVAGAAASLTSRLF